MARRYSKTVPRRRRRVARKRIYRRKRITRLSKIHSFTRTCEIATLSGSNIADTFGGLTFSLGMLPNSTEFTNLFDQFRICAVKLEIVPRYTSSDMNPQATAPLLPNIHTVIDYNDISTPGNLDTLFQYQNYKRTRGNTIHKRYFKPAVLAAAYEGAVTTAYTSTWNRWLDTLDSGTLHYGLKYCIDQSFTGAWYKVYAKFFIQCKGVK